MKEGDKRIRNDDFEQVESCATCGVLFWACSELELGNWQSYCEKCRKRIAREESIRNKEIIKNGTPHYGYKGKIFCWTLGEDTFFNPEYEPSKDSIIPIGEPVREVWTEENYFANGFCDIGKIEKAHELSTVDTSKNIK